MGLHEFTEEFWIVLFKDVYVEKICSVVTMFQNGVFCKWQILKWSDRISTKFLIASARQQINAENDEKV